MSFSLFDCCRNVDNALPEGNRTVENNDEQVVIASKEENDRARNCLSEVIKKLESIIPHARYLFGKDKYSRYIHSAHNAVNDLQNFSNQLATYADYANLNDQNNAIQRIIIEKLGSYQQVLEKENSKTQLKKFSEAFCEDDKNDLEYAVIQTKMDSEFNLVSSL